MRYNLALLVVFSALIGQIANAADISWSVVNPLTGPNDVSTNGTLLEALNFSGGLVADDYDVTINGVTFEGLVNGLEGTNNAASQFNDPTTPTAFYFSSDSTRVTASGDDNYFVEEGGLEVFNDLLSRRLFAGGNTVTLSNLMAGSTYEIQLFMGGTSSPDPELGSGVSDNRHIEIDRVDDGMGNITQAFGSITTTNFGSETGDDLGAMEAQPNPAGFVLTGQFTADDVTQAFTISNVRNGSVPNAAFYLPAYQLRLLPDAPVLTGDYNDDGVVNLADYTVWRDNLGGSITLDNEDPTQTPGMVTAEDYTVWKNAFGNGSSASAIVPVAIPEPATAILLASMVIAVGCNKGRSLR